MSAVEMLETKAHELIGQLNGKPEKLAAVVHLLEVMVDDEGEEEVFSPEDIAKIEASREYFRNGGQGISFEQAVAECGFTMEQITGQPKGSVAESLSEENSASLRRSG